MVSLEEGSLSTREGRVVFLEDVLRKAIEKTREIIEEKSPHLEHKDEIAEKVGVGAIIFQELSNNRIKDYMFSTGENTCPSKGRRRLCSVHPCPGLQRPEQGKRRLLAGRRLQPADAGTGPASLLAPDPTPTIAAATPAAPAAAAAASGPVVLTALADGVWVRLYEEGGERLTERTLKVGETLEVPVTAKDPRINTGRPDALSVTVGGQPVAKLSEKAETISGLPVSAAALVARAAQTPAAGTGPTPASAATVPLAARRVPATRPAASASQAAAPAAAPASAPANAPAPAGEPATAPGR